MVAHDLVSAPSSNTGNMNMAIGELMTEGSLRKGWP
jgi:hypothetical protein